jgi:hypothetical protein
MQYRTLKKKSPKKSAPDGLIAETDVFAARLGANAAKISKLAENGTLPSGHSQLEKLKIALEQTSKAEELLDRALYDLIGIKAENSNPVPAAQRPSGPQLFWAGLSQAIAPIEVTFLPGKPARSNAEFHLGRFNHSVSTLQGHLVLALSRRLDGETTIPFKDIESLQTDLKRATGRSVTATYLRGLISRIRSKLAAKGQKHLLQTSAEGGYRLIQPEPEIKR